MSAWGDMRDALIRVGRAAPLTERERSLLEPFLWIKSFEWDREAFEDEPLAVKGYDAIVTDTEALDE